MFSAFAIALGVALVAAPSAHAGFYGGGSFGQSSTDLGFSDFNDGSLTGGFDDSDTAWRLYGGFKMFKFFAVEAGWADMGEYTLNATSTGSLQYPAGPINSASSVDGYSVSALGTVPVGILVMLISDRSKRVGDYAAGTVVVHEGREERQSLRQALRDVDELEPGLVVPGGELCLDLVDGRAGGAHRGLELLQGLVQRLLARSLG